MYFVMIWDENVKQMWVIRNAYKILVGKPQGKVTLRRLRHIWKDNIKMDPSVTVFGVVTALNWLSVQAYARLLLTRWWTFALNKSSKFIVPLSNYQIFKEGHSPWS
jgi:hypothetical protein